MHQNFIKILALLKEFIEQIYLSSIHSLDQIRMSGGGLGLIPTRSGSLIHGTETLHGAHCLLSIVLLDWLIKFRQESQLVIIIMWEHHGNEVMTYNQSYDQSYKM